ncbi:MAG: SDR family NAD(P)-dependent oxidoreductase [Cyanobacteria bacterium J06632_22]
MLKTILITGSTDGIGLETAKMLVARGHRVLLHGRNPTKLKTVERTLAALPGKGDFESYVADFSDMANVASLAQAVSERHARLDVLINNAGVYHASRGTTAAGLDVRFAVNAIAPYLLTNRLLPLLSSSGRVINLSSAAQSPVSLQALTGQVGLSEGAAYAQSKLALTMWSCNLGNALMEKGPFIIAVNPGSLLGSKMVKEAFGIVGGDIRIGAEILVRAALADEFAAASGQYFDNDSGQFAAPHPDALNAQKVQAVIRTIETILADVRG